jgi:hypothetical protein
MKPVSTEPTLIPHPSPDSPQQRAVPRKSVAFAYYVTRRSPPGKVHARDRSPCGRLTRGVQRHPRAYPSSTSTCRPINTWHGGPQEPSSRLWRAVYARSCKRSSEIPPSPKVGVNKGPGPVGGDRSVPSVRSGAKWGAYPVQATIRLKGWSACCPRRPCLRRLSYYSSTTTWSASPRPHPGQVLAGFMYVLLLCSSLK